MSSNQQVTAVWYHQGYRDDLHAPSNSLRKRTARWLWHVRMFACSHVPPSAPPGSSSLSLPHRPCARAVPHPPPFLLQGTLSPWQLRTDPPSLRTRPCGTSHVSEVAPPEVLGVFFDSASRPQGPEPHTFLWLSSVPLSVRSSVRGHACYSRFGALRDNAAVDIHGRACVWPCVLISSVCVRGRGTAGQTVT